MNSEERWRPPHLGLGVRYLVEPVTNCLNRIGPSLPTTDVEWRLLVEPSIDMLTVPAVSSIWFSEELDGTPLTLSSEEFSLLRRHRIVAALDPSLFAPESAEQIKFHQVNTAVLQMRLVKEAQKVAEILAAEGIEMLVLKGLATSVLDYDQPARRHTGDVDVLVEEGAITNAVRTLASHGYEIQSGQLPIRNSALKGYALYSPSGIEVDVHRRLSQYADRETSVLFSDRVPLSDSGLWALSGKYRAAHAAVHLVDSNGRHKRLSGLLDITQILEGDTCHGLSDIKSAAQAIGLEAQVGIGLSMEAAVSGRSANEIREWCMPGYLERSALMRAEHSPIRSLLRKTAGRSNFKSSARYVLGLAVPSVDDLRDQQMRADYVVNVRRVFGSFPRGNSR